MGKFCAGEVLCGEVLCGEVLSGNFLFAHCCFQEYSRKRDISAELDANLPSVLGEGGLGGTSSGSQSCSAEYLLQIEEGYLMIPKLGISTIKPSSNFTKTVYVSMYRLQEDGTRLFMATDVPHEESAAAIVTSSGGIVSAKHRKRPWVDLGGRSHYCDDCQHVGEVCSPCEEAGGCPVVFESKASSELLSGVKEDLEKLSSDLDSLKKRFDGKGEAEKDVCDMADDVSRLTDSVAAFKNKMNL